MQYREKISYLGENLNILVSIQIIKLDYLDEIN